MSEKLYAFLLKLYPDHFRRTYGVEMVRLVRDRARSERGFVSSLRLWLDLLRDIATSLLREYNHVSTAPIVAAQSLDGERSFPLLVERRLNPALLCFGGTLSIVLFWACVFVVEHRSATRFPQLFSPRLVQMLAERAPAESPYAYDESAFENSAGNWVADASSWRSVSAGAYGFCMTARRDIPSNSPHSLFSFHFAAPGASGTALIDGKVVKVFKNEQRLAIRAHVTAGDHQFLLRLDKPAVNTFTSGNADFEYCQGK